MSFVTTAAKCDRSGEFIKRWYRFTGNAGTKMPTTCVPSNRCQTHAPGWVNGALPTTNGETVTRKVCFNWSSNCCKWYRNIRIRNCGSFLVFELVPVGCHSRYCGTP
jgi:hypothetical protein